jgi:rare lipoprotein A
VRRRLAQREFALAAVALLAAVIALAIAAKTRSNSDDLPAAYGSYPAKAGAAGPASFGKHTACGTVIRAKTQGVAHPVLPCGARIYITYNGKHVLTQVIDRGPNRADREFELTDALAKLLGLTGVQRIRWSYAASD